MRKILIFTMVIALLIPFFTGCFGGPKPLNVIVVFHNHQPFYKNIDTNSYILPWVRLHGAKDYYRMPFIVSQFPDIHITFDLSSSLIVQIQDYMNGAIDEHLRVSKIDPKDLTLEDKLFMLSVPGGFFDINWDHIVKKVPLYLTLLNKREEAFKKYGSNDKVNLVNSFTPQDYLNLQTLFNLFWLDTEFIKNDKDLKPLLDKAYNSINFTIDERNLVLKKQEEIISKIFDEYKTLLNKKQIELVSTPYAHPISPLLIDFGLQSELVRHLDRSKEVFEKIFSATPNGIWASECALNDETLKLFSENGIKWTISDIDNLTQLGIDKNDPIKAHLPYTVNGVTVFFRDKYLSDGISFRYSGKPVEEAIKDVEDTLTNLQKSNLNGDLVYTIALDGENAWEYYENDGNDFLYAFYKKLSDLEKKGIIRVVTPSEYLSKFSGKPVQEHTVSALDLKGKDISNINSYANLPRREYNGQFGESSWVNPTLDTWIGEPQENIGWMWLIDAYSTYNNLKEKVDAQTRKDVEDLLLIAEGSDWFWWYGSDQSSGNDRSFDRLYKLYLAKIYSRLGQSIPEYLFGNFFPDGEPYSSTELSLKEGVVSQIPLIHGSARVQYDKNSIIFELPSNQYVIAVYNGKSLKTFLSEQSKPTVFNFDKFPFVSDSIGMPVDFEIYGNNGKFVLDLTNLNLNRLYIAIASIKNGTVSLETIPIKLKLPVKIQGEVVGELYDEANDDNGPGTYTYPLNSVFHGKGHLYDLISFKMFDANSDYVLQYQIGSIGDNPWNGPNGFSFQIIETYFDIRDGGKIEPIDINGPNVTIDKNHPWDVAIRVAGWSYGNYIVDSNGNVTQGELGISVDNEKNTITVILPKKYLSIDPNYKPYVCIISGNQDGYGAGYFRSIMQTASEWACGGGDPDAISAQVLPKVLDIFVPKEKTQKEILSSYDVKNKKLAELPMLPLEKAKEVPNLVSSYTLDVPNTTPPLSTFKCTIQIKNIGKGLQKDLEGDEFSLVIPKYVELVKVHSSSGNIVKKPDGFAFSGSIKPNDTVVIEAQMKLTSDVPNAYKETFVGILNFDGEGIGKNSSTTSFDFSFFVKYKIEIGIPFGENYILRNGTKVYFSKNTFKSYYDDRIKDVVVPIEDLSKALGIDYQFDSKKLTLTFMESKYEHWIGQNKSLLNGNAIPLVPNEPEIRSSFENGILVFPLKALAYAFKFKYNIDSVNKIAYLYYLP